MFKKKNIRGFLSKFKAQEFAAIIGILTFLTLSVVSFAVNCSELRSDVLRLHVLANSDTQRDQEMKLAVRDKLLEAGAAIFDGSVTATDAAEKIEPQIADLEDAAREVVKAYGEDYDVKITVCEEYFDTRAYESFTMPAGMYNAVKVIIGEGAGRNWWCVMFPPLCLPAAEGDNEDDVDMVFNNNEIKIVESSPKYEVRFKIVELYEKLVNSINGKKK